MAVHGNCVCAYGGFSCSFLGAHSVNFSYRCCFTERTRCQSWWRFWGTWNEEGKGNNKIHSHTSNQTIWRHPHSHICASSHAHTRTHTHMHTHTHTRTHTHSHTRTSAPLIAIEEQEKNMWRNCRRNRWKSREQKVLIMKRLSRVSTSHGRQRQLVPGWQSLTKNNVNSRIWCGRKDGALRKTVSIHSADYGLLSLPVSVAAISYVSP